jgi:hypothetical protein
MPNDERSYPPQRQEPPGSTGAMQPLPDHGEQSYVGAHRLVGRRALLTGGDSGIGRAVAIAYAREGADVAIGYRPEEQADAEETADWVREAGRRVVLLPGDLTDEQTARDLPQRAVDGLGALDILVNNAAFQVPPGGGIAELESDRLERVVRTNLYALLWVTQAALPHLPRGAAIINTSSIQAYEPSGPSIDYASTKAAIVNVTVNLATELGSRGIRVNAVAPGPIWTPLQPATQDPAHLTTFGQNTPLGRAGQPAEVAPAFVFLASQRDASYVSGAVLGVTGGRPVF